MPQTMPAGTRESLQTNVVEAARELLANLDDAEQTKDEQGKDYQDIRELRSALKTLDASTGQE